MELRYAVSLLVPLERRNVRTSVSILLLWLLLNIHGTCIGGAEIMPNSFVISLKIIFNNWKALRHKCSTRGPLNPSLLGLFV